MTIDIAIPTTESGDIIEETLRQAAAAVDHADVTVGQLVIVDNDSDDDTVATARSIAEDCDWRFRAIVEPSTLPEARERAIGAIETDWFWFLDDDVRVRETYLAEVLDTIAPSIGAVQGRKLSRTEHPSDWVRRRSRRGTTNCPLVRTDAVRDVTIPDDLLVLEGQFIRRWVEASGYVWTFNPHARFEHECQERHPIGWTEGYLAGRYGLKTFHNIALNVPFSLATGRDPIPHAKRAAGYVAGYFQSKDTPQPETSKRPAMTDGGKR